MPYLGNVPSSFNVGTDNINNDAITTAKIADGAILNADVNSAAAIAGTKISPDFGSQTIATTGIFSHALGSASAPTITFTGDLNTGLYSPGADQLAISTNGTGRLFIDSSGRLLVGVSSTSGLQTGARHVFNDGSGAAFTGVSVGNPGGGLNNVDLNITAWSGSGSNYFTSKIRQIGDGSLTFQTQATSSADGAGTTTERLRITSAGFVGIGTSSPGALLHIVSGDAIQIIENSAATSNATLQLKYPSRTWSIANRGADLSGSLTFRDITASADRLVIDSSGRVGIGTTSPSQTLTTVGNIKIAGAQASNIAKLCLTRTDQSWSINNETDLRFYRGTGDTDSPGSMTVVFTNGGNVGIGTTTPSFPLEVRGSTNGLQLLGSDNVNATWRIGTPSNAVVAFGGNTDHNVAFGGFNAASNAFTERCRIDTSGRLLVGTSTSGTSTGSGQFRLGGSGSEGGTVFLTNSAGSVANNGTLDITVGTSTIIIYVGFLIVHAANANTNADRTQTTFTVFGSPQNSSFTATQISTASAGANSTFTVTSPSPGVVRVTNTSGRATHISMCFMGTGWFMT